MAFSMLGKGAGEQSEITKGAPDKLTDCAGTLHGWVCLNHCETGQGTGVGRGRRIVVVGVAGMLVALEWRLLSPLSEFYHLRGTEVRAPGSLVGLEKGQCHPTHMGRAVLTRHTSVATSMLRQLNQLS